MRLLLASLLMTAAVPAWTVRDVGTPPGKPGAFMIAKAIADDGTVVGDAWTGPLGSQHSTGFVWRGGRLRLLTYPGSTWVETRAVNARGDVVGDAAFAGGNRQVGLLWPAGGGAPRVLGSLGGAITTPVAIDAAGDVTGDARTADSTTHAFLWRNGAMTDLGTFGGAESHAVALNAKGQAIGSADTADGKTRAFLWSHGSLEELPTIGAFDTAATGINDAGLVVGQVQTHVGQPVEAVSWRNGALRRLRAHARAVAVNRGGDVLVELDRAGGDAYGAQLLSHTGRVWTLGGLGGSPPPSQGGALVVFGLNDRAQVLGLGYTKAGAGRRTFVWQNGRTTVLPTLDGVDPPWGSPASMNSRGEIVGTAYVTRAGRNYQHVVVWTPR